MSNETVALRHWLAPFVVALAIGTAGGCGGQEPGDSNSSKSGTTDVLVKSKSGGPTDRVVELDGGTGSGTLTFTDGPFAETTEYLGGLTIVDVADAEAAKMWAGKIAEACGWPQEVRRFGRRPGG